MSGSRPLLLILLASLGVSLFIALTLPLLDPDEGRNAEVAREMAAGSDWMVPRLAGMPYLDKPPAFFWATALSVRVLGHTPLAARVPSIAAGLLTLLLLGMAARRAGRTRFATVAMALLAVAPLFMGLSAYVIFDMLLTLCVTIVWLGLARDVEVGATITTHLAMFAAIALGILTKGPVMLAWAVGGSVGAALLLRSRAPLRWLAWWPGWIVALGPPAIWLALVAHRFPEFPHYALIEETFERVSTGSFHRDQPWWFVPVTLVVGALPWSLATPWSRARFERAQAAARVGASVGLGFVAFAVVFFTFSHSKLVTYLLPAFPPLAWTAAVMWEDPAPARRSGVIVAVLAGLALTSLWPLVQEVVGEWMHDGTSPALAMRTVVMLAVLATAMAGGLVSLKSKRAGQAILACVLVLPALIIGLDASEAPRIGAAPPPSGTPLARAIQTLGPGRIRYERCYSPGTDYLLGQVSTLVTTTGEETTSNYITRYRPKLESRGEWRARAVVDTSDHSGIIVTSNRPTSPDREGWRMFFSDARFRAFRFTGWRSLVGPPARAF